MRNRNLVNILLFILGIGILGALVIWSGPGKSWNALKKAELPLMFSGLFVFAFYLFVRSLRWYTMLKLIKNELKLREFVPVYFVNFMISNITPGRSGEALAPFLMKKYIGSSTGSGFSIVIIDRVLDILFIVVASLLSFIYFVYSTNLPPGINISFYIAIGILVTMSGIMLILAFWEKGGFAFLRAFTNVFFCKRQKYLLEGLSSFYESVKIVRKVIPKVIIYLIISWFLLAISYFLRVRAIMDSDFMPVTTCWIISLSIGMASFIPSGLGSSQASFAVLIALMGNDLADATAASILAKFAALSVIFVLGLGFLFYIRSKDDICQNNH